MSKTASEIVAKSQARNREAGGGRLTFNLSPSEMAEWRRLMDRVGDTQKAALVFAIGAGLQRNEPTQADVIDWIKRNTKERG
jgi:hypothetical protein